MRSIFLILLVFAATAHRAEAGKSTESENDAQSERPRPSKNLRGALQPPSDRELEQTTEEFSIEFKSPTESIEMGEELHTANGEGTRQRREDERTVAGDASGVADDEDRDLLDISDFMSKTSPNIPLPTIDWEDLVMPLPTHYEET